MKHPSVPGLRPTKPDTAITRAKTEKENDFWNFVFVRLTSGCIKFPPTVPPNSLALNDFSDVFSLGGMLFPTSQKSKLTSPTVKSRFQAHERIATLMTDFNT